MDLNTLNLDPDPELQPYLDPDPGIQGYVLDIKKNNFREFFFFYWLTIPKKIMASEELFSQLQKQAKLNFMPAVEYEYSMPQNPF